MPDDSLLLGQLAEEYTARVREGQLPDLDDYATRHPQLAERMRALFPTLLLLEGLANGSPTDVAPRTPERLAPGTVLGPYRIEREIGRGGMGVVYEAVHRVLERRVALKVLRAEGLEGGALERFLREAQTAAGLHHTNIVPVFDLGQVGGVPYYAMQLIAGRGLDRVLRDQGDPTTLALSAETSNAGEPLGLTPTSGQRVAWRQVAAWGIQAADGLAYAHERGVIHRDIKPSNLLLDEHGIVWITDFGLARRVQDVALTRNGALLGTPRYMSPEQAQAARQPVDRRTDIYSLGATLYELATGRPAFDAPTPVEVVVAIVERQPVPPRRLEPKIPRDLETIILKAMAKRPDDRYQDAADLAEDLRRLVRQEPVRARRIGSLGRTVRWCRRNPRLAAVSFVVAALIAILIASHIASLHIANSMITAEKLIAEGHRDAALTSANDARDALELSKDHLARSLYEQARAIRSSTQPGRRDKALVLLHSANELRLRKREGTAEGSPPSAVELRSEALAALLLRDVRLVRELPVLHDTIPVLTRPGGHALVYWSKPREKKTGVRIVDLADGKELARFEEAALGDTVGNVALADDGMVIAHGTGEVESAVQLFDATSGGVIRDLAWPKDAPKEFNEYLTIPMFVPGRPMLAGYRSTKNAMCVVVWDLDNEDAAEGRVMAHLACNRPPSTGYHPAIAFNRTGKQLIMREGDKTLVMIDVDNPKATRKYELPLPTGPHLLRSPRGGLVAVAGIRPDMLRSSLILWDAVHGVERAHCEGDFTPEGWFPMAFDPEGNFIAATCIDGSIRIFTTADGKEWLRFGGQFDQSDALLTWSADGRLIWAGDVGLHVWHVLHENGIVTAVPSAPRLFALDLSRDGQWIAMVNGAPRKGVLTLAERATGKRREWNVPGAMPLTNPIVSFQPDSKQVALLSDRQLLVVDIASGKETLHRTTFGTDALWPSLALLSDGRAWAVLTKEDAVLVWDVTNNREVRKFNNMHVPQTLSPDGRWLLQQPPFYEAAAWRYVLREVATGREVLRIEPPAESGPVVNPGATFSADGNRLAIWEFPARTDDARLPERAVKVIDLASGKVLLRVVDSALNSQADFSVDGRYLALGQNDGSCRFWDVDRQMELFRWHAVPGRVGDWVGTTADGGPLVAGSLWTEMLLLDLPRLRRELAALKLDW